VNAGMSKKAAEEWKKAATSAVDGPGKKSYHEDDEQEAATAVHKRKASLRDLNKNNERKRTAEPPTMTEEGAKKPKPFPTTARNGPPNYLGVGECVQPSSGTEDAGVLSNNRNHPHNAVIG